jgi:lipopolysaccharide biosynthesis glycosyltransferase
VRAAANGRGRQAICLCCDEAFLPFALFLACQIDTAAPDRRYDICLCSDSELCLPAAFADRGFRLVRLNPGSGYADLQSDRLARSTYLRLWLVEALGQDYDRVLYLDSDMYLVAGDPGDLFGVDLGGRAIGAVRDMQQWSRPSRLVSEFEALGLAPLPYFNAGLMLIDTAAFRDQNLCSRALALAEEHPGAVHHHDQSLLNGVLRGDFAELSPVWNWQWVGKRPLFTAWADVRIVHFVGHEKPWNDRSDRTQARYHAAYADFLGQHFPGTSLPLPTRPRAALKMSRLAKSIGQHILSYPAYRRLVRRFPDAGRAAP